ncbi:hypothetical protein [Sinanaerobacter chloroacetimidivorans]|uniref:Uncharacterized protein n=1 Tax=Sinanaerobacter chloroacetimidivorans TaxID=2818044 RepID=A0A8J7W3N0_9FIRM|nr:hypothetical protein [Sinanaerobacter chloroacetimidivorans]MBR0599781.1 hypothetical protein [Sinanaerobacter chloroacetimidivorans]
MKWLDLSYSDFYIPCEDNQKTVRGYLLASFGVDLERLPFIFFEPFNKHKTQSGCGGAFTERKVLLSDIFGTSHNDYGGRDIITAFMKIKRAKEYILSGRVTKNKYFRMLKKPVDKQDAPVVLSQVDGKYYVDGNDNHRVIFYKIMMLAEIHANCHHDCTNECVLTRDEFMRIRKKYWLNAKVRHFK